jgi:transcription antitermination protein NusB
MARRRHLSRIAVMQVLFEREKRVDFDADEALGRNADELGDFDEPFARTLLTGVLENEVKIKEEITAHAPGWTLERMDPVSRCVLHVGTYELLFGGDAPPAVVINEAIEVAKEYGTEESGKFVNGVLNAMVKK